ncbi:MAG TPA: hypothetical protein VJ766_10015 [Pseudoxanthomonas sp.]|nr:hypothetical protein [Pseudoxanthomonas sp.]
MKRHTLLLSCLLLAPMPAFADSCGTRIVVVNHRADAVSVELKSFYADRALAAPSPRDFDAPLYGNTVPPYLSSLQQIEVPAHGSASVAFRRLCVGDVWVNWREVSADGRVRSSGQMQPGYNEPIHIR